jgi:hypothetical protein
VPSLPTSRSCSPWKFELVTNAETTRMLGPTVPPTLIAIAGEVKFLRSFVSSRSWWELFFFAGAKSMRPRQRHWR